MRNSLRYEMTPQQEKKHAIKTMIACLIIGGIFIAFASSVFFGYCRPFTKFEYYECVIMNQEWFKIDSTHFKVIYYVDGVKYEKILRITNSRGGTSKICFYYNVEDPYDTILRDRTLFLKIMPCVAGFGGLFIIFGVNFFFKWKKKDNKEFLEWKKNRDDSEKKSP